MAYDETKLARLKHLKELATKVHTDCATKTELNELSGRVDGLVSAGGEPNKIEVIKVNGAIQEIKEKAVDIAIPGYTVEKSDNSGDFAAVYQFKKDGQPVGAAINIPKDMVVQSGTVETNPAGQPEGTYIKLVLQNVKDPLYINVGSLIEYVTSGSGVGDMVVVTIDENTHKVTAAITDGTIIKAKLHADLASEIDGKAAKVAGATAGNFAGLGADGSLTDSGKKAADFVTAEAGKRLMTDAEGTKLGGIAEGATKVESSANDGNIKVNGQEVQVVKIATDTEVTDMLNEVFAPAVKP